MALFRQRSQPLLRSTPTERQKMASWSGTPCVTITMGALLFILGQLKRNSSFRYCRHLASRKTQLFATALMGHARVAHLVSLDAKNLLTCSPWNSAVTLISWDRICASDMWGLGGLRHSTLRTQCWYLCSAMMVVLKICIGTKSPGDCVFYSAPMVIRTRKLCWWLTWSNQQVSIRLLCVDTLLYSWSLQVYTRSGFRHSAIWTDFACSPLCSGINVIDTDVQVLSYERLAHCMPRRQFVLRHWGCASDPIRRMPVLLGGLFRTIQSMVGFGLRDSFGVSIDVLDWEHLGNMSCICYYKYRLISADK